MTDPNQLQSNDAQIPSQRPRRSPRFASGLPESTVPGPSGESSSEPPKLATSEACADSSSKRSKVDEDGSEQGEGLVPGSAQKDTKIAKNKDDAIIKIVEWMREK